MGISELRVAAIMENGKLRPIWIDRRGRRINITEVTYEWKSHLGQELLRHYAVTDGHNTYELVFNSATLQWTFNFSG